MNVRPGHNIALQVIYDVIYIKIVAVLRLNPEGRQFGDISEKGYSIYHNLL